MHAFVINVVENMFPMFGELSNFIYFLSRGGEARIDSKSLIRKIFIHVMSIIQSFFLIDVGIKLSINFLLVSYLLIVIGLNTFYVRKKLLKHVEIFNIFSEICEEY